MSSNSENSDEDPDLDTLKFSLIRHISSIKSVGSFATSGKINLVPPGISIDPVGLIRLPLSEEDAHALVEISRHASFGNGLETVLDSSIRRTWEIDGAAISFLNPEWQNCLDEVVEKATKELGIAGGSNSIRAELYKMLIHDKDATFKPHEDTEKAKGMIGTLVICLPSQHEGGNVCLKHGERRVTLNSSDVSAFGATYLAWYIDVLPENEPVTKGYRWVLTYNLIQEWEDLSACSASGLDSRIQDLIQVFEEWEDLDPQVPCLAWPLEHQYSGQGLQLDLLKDSDYCRVRHVADGCLRHGRFHAFLANMELAVRDHQCEDNAIHSNLTLTRIVDVGGFNLTIYGQLPISQSILLEGIHGEHRNPDVQLGGGYMGSGPTPIDRFYEDSILIIVPNRHILAVLTNERAPASVYTVERMIKHLQGCAKRQSNREFLVQVCRSALSLEYKGLGSKDDIAGCIAVAAALWQETLLFTDAIDCTVNAFEIDSYVKLGELICFSHQCTSEQKATQNSISEEDFIRALTCSKTLRGVYRAVRAFKNGFLQRNPLREQIIPKDYILRWLDTVIIKYVDQMLHVQEDDAIAVVEMIMDASDNDFRQNVLYQSARMLVDWFKHEKVFLTALLVEIFVIEATNAYLSSLGQRVLRLVVPSFELGTYVRYFSTRSVVLYQFPDSKLIASAVTRIYQSASRQERATLLVALRTQAVELTKAQTKSFLPPILTGLIEGADPVFAEVRKCVKSLVNTYVIQTVCTEPVRPSDWSRPEEVVPGYLSSCKHARQMNAFLRDPKTRSRTISFENNCGCRVQSYCHCLDQKTTNKKTKFWKTTRGWERAHRAWEDKAQVAKSVLSNVAQGKPQKYVLDQYERAMEALRLKNDDASTAKGRYLLRSTQRE